MEICISNKKYKKVKDTYIKLSLRPHTIMTSQTMMMMTFLSSAAAAVEAVQRVPHSCQCVCVRVCANGQAACSG